MWLSTARDLLAVLRLIPRVERGRRLTGPAPLLRELRQLATQRPIRDERGRHRLRRLISVVDRLIPSGPNCYRRALLEIALDPTAAHEPLRFGLQAHGGPLSGHAWLEHERAAVRRYDAEFSA